MKAVVQRVSKAAVEVGGELVGAIGPGLLVLLGVAKTDTVEDAGVIAAKIAGLRIFSDAGGQMNLSVSDVNGSALIVSQFTLYGDTARGRRPSFAEAAPGDRAEPLVEAVAQRLHELDVPVARGRFGAKMSVSLVNEGPVTIILETVDGRLV